MFASLKIGSKLFLGFGLVMLLAASVGVLAMWRMANVIPTSRMLAEVEGPQLEALTHGERALHEMMLAIRTFMYTSDAAKLAEGQQLATKIDEQLALAQAAEEQKGAAGDIEKIRKMRANLADYNALVSQTAQNDAATASGRRESNEVSTELAATIDQFATTALAELSKQIKSSATADMLEQHVHTVAVLTRLQQLVTTCRVNNLNGQATRDRKLIEASIEQFTTIGACLSELEPLMHGEAERRNLAELTAAVAKYQSGIVALLDLWKASEELGRKRYDTSFSLVALTEKGTGDIVDTVKASADTTFKLLSATRTQVGIGMGLMLLCGALISWFITHALTTPIQRALPIFAAVEQGDLTQRVPVSTQDEVGQIGLQFNKVVDNLQRVIGQVTQAANEVAGAATQIAAGSEEIAHGMHEQASQTTQVSSAVEEMSSTIVEVARKSSDAAQTAEAAGRHAERGGEVVQQTVGGINQIAEVVRESAAAMTELGRSGQQIGEIIGVINDIADQTNLLALNAAIEAARAGEHGRGFAVVADEVRKLAERTTQATKQVTESVRTIQQSTTEAVQNMQRGTQRVDEGVEMARNAGDALASIVTGSREVSSMIQSIAAASEQQSAAAEQISRSVEQISAVTNQSSEGVSQAAQAAQQLSTKSEFLQQLVSQFKI